MILIPNVFTFIDWKTEITWRILPTFTIEQSNEPRLVENDENDSINFHGSKNSKEAEYIEL